MASVESRLWQSHTEKRKLADIVLHPNKWMEMWLRS
jgi:hypothetical protein